MQIYRAKHAGFCFGVRRAYDRALAAADSKNAVATLGELIHNPEVLEELDARGVRSVASISRLRGGTVIIRAHGISDQKRRQLQKKNLKIVDASCPFVQKIHAAVKKFAAQKIPVVIVGRRTHPEMRAVIEDFPATLVVAAATDPRLRKFGKNERVAVLAQTTEMAANFTAVAEKLRQLGARVQMVNTICGATAQRQSAVVTLAQKVELVLVVGGKKSNNTRQLYQLARKYAPSFWIENEREIKKKWFAGISKVGVTAGASTPEVAIIRVEKKIRQIGGGI